MMYSIIVLALIIYAIWLFFFPIIIVGKLDKIINLMKED